VCKGATDKNISGIFFNGSSRRFSYAHAGLG
jgi:hypothetical protein